MIRILVPLDGSPAAEESLAHAFAVAKVFPAELTLLRVITEAGNGAAVHSDSVDHALWRHQARMYLDSLLDRYMTEDLPIRREVAEGRPAEAIVLFMAENKPDLLVLTRYGRGNALDFATGGTAQKIISSADCSVLLLDPRQPAVAEQQYRRILVPIDNSKEADCAVAVATMIAEIHHASLLLVYVTREPRLPGGAPATRRANVLLSEMQRLVHNEAELRLKEIAAKIPSEVAVATRVLVSPDTALAIESLAHDDNSDLVVLHAIAGPEQHHRYSPESQSLILYSHRPLFILRAAAGEGLASNFRSVYLDQSCTGTG